MKKDRIEGALPAKKELVDLNGTFRAKYRIFAVFLLACAILVAAFAVSAVWLRQGGSEWLRGLGSFWSTQEPDSALQNGSETESGAEPEESGSTEPAPIDPIPADATPVVSADLAYLSLGRDYLHNETHYSPDVAALSESLLSRPAVGAEPLVLILHTHTSEGYLPSGSAYVEGALGDATYTRDETQNILAVGKVLAEALNEKGITAIHCTVMHDEPTLGGSYARSAETVRSYLEAYPSIEYVIDLHRDSVLNGAGEYLRAVTEIDGEAVAQVMAVVGTDGNGTPHESWEENLALALQLRAALNADDTPLCRPVSLRNASFYQELARHSLLLEIGTAANSVEEAERAARLVGKALADLILGA